MYNQYVDLKQTPMISTYIDTALTNTSNIQCNTILKYHRYTSAEKYRTEYPVRTPYSMTGTQLLLRYDIFTTSVTKCNTLVNTLFGNFSAGKRTDNEYIISYQTNINDSSLSYEDIESGIINDYRVLSYKFHTLSSQDISNYSGFTGENSTTSYFQTNSKTQLLFINTGYYKITVQSAINSILKLLNESSTCKTFTSFTSNYYTSGVVQTLPLAPKKGSYVIQLYAGVKRTETYHDTYRLLTFTLNGTDMASSLVSSATHGRDKTVYSSLSIGETGTNTTWQIVPYNYSLLGDQNYFGYKNSFVYNMFGLINHNINL